MSSLEKLMQEYQPEDGIIEAAMNADGVQKMTGEEKERILQKTLEKAGLQGDKEMTEKQGTMFVEEQVAEGRETSVRIQSVSGGHKRRRIMVLTAACIALLALAGIGYAAGGLDTAFKAWFGPSTEEQLAALESAGTQVGAEAKDQGTTVSVREVIGDESTVNVLFDIVAPEGTVLDADQYVFYRPLVMVEGSNGLGYSFSELAKDSSRGNVYTMILSLSSDQPLNGKKMKLDLTDFCVYKDEDVRKAAKTGAVVNDADYVDDNYRIVLPGHWNIEFPLDYKDTSVKVYPNAPVEKDGAKATATELRVSPMSLSIELKVRGLKDAFDYVINGSTETVAFGSETDIEVTLKDGTVLPSRTAGSFSEGFRAKLDLQFESIIDVNEIESITLCGQELWKNK